MRGTLLITVVLFTISTKFCPSSARHVHVIDPVYCQGKADGNYIHPTDCTRFVSCAKHNASERNCPPCNHELDPTRCLSAGRLVYSEAKDTCLWADETECKNGGDGDAEKGSSQPSEPPYRPPPGPPEGEDRGGEREEKPGGGGGPPAQEGKHCDPALCKNEGYCLHYFRCDPGSKTWVKERCGAGLLWNPLSNGTKQIHGGNCGDPHKLAREILDKYRKDPHCLECHWNELKECSAKYLYQAPNQFYPMEQELECDQNLVFSKAKATCVPCHDAKKIDGKSCC